MFPLQLCEILYASSTFSLDMKSGGGRANIEYQKHRFWAGDGILCKTVFFATFLAWFGTKKAIYTATTGTVRLFIEAIYEPVLFTGKKTPIGKKKHFFDFLTFAEKHLIIWKIFGFQNKLIICQTVFLPVKKKQVHI